MEAQIFSRKKSTIGMQGASGCLDVLVMEKDSMNMISKVCCVSSSVLNKF